jgi:uncharacterized phage-associated protein
MRPYSPLAVANWFIEHRGLHVMDHMKLQKLVYCAHGWWLISRPGSLLNERPQVWKYGPVFRSLYAVLKPFGSTPITDMQARSPFERPQLVTNDEETVQLLTWILTRYGHLSALALSDMTHKQNTAWYRLSRDHDFVVPNGLEIPDDYIRAEFNQINNSDSLNATATSS